MSELPEDAWTRIELRQLVALVAVAQHGSLSAAADALGVDPATLRRRVATLEEIVGTALVGEGAAVLTEAGKIVAAHAERIAAEAQEAEAALGGRDPEAS
jgi:DNA-binding transcriptional LysR family regulator